MPWSGISVRKSSSSSSPLPMTSSDDHKPGRRGRRGVRHAGVYGAVVITSLVWLVLLHVTGVRDWTILCGGRGAGAAGGGEVAEKSAVEGGYRLSYIASSQEDGVGSGLVELMDGEGKRSEVVRPKVLGFVGINTGFDSGPRRTALRQTWFPSSLQELEK